MRYAGWLCVCVIACGPSGRSGDDTPGDDTPGDGDGGMWEGDPVDCFHAAQTHTYVGCDFYPTVHPNFVKAYMDFAVVVANTSQQTAQVTVEREGMMVA